MVTASITYGCRLLQMGLDMPFGFLLASLSTKEAALKAAEHDPNPSPKP